MANEDILERIQALVAKEHELRSSAPVDTAELNHLEEMLDQCWDLLRQRRAHREFGESPSDAQARPVETVENYQQ